MFNYTADNWDHFLYVSSAETSQQFLLKKYERNHIKDANKYSYDNCYSFVYYIDQGKSFFDQAGSSPLNIRPILLFYGFIFLIKACLLTVDPEYPATTSVLAHGVSTRKRKKQNFQYLNDEVKIQKNGLLPHFTSKMFYMNHIVGNKFNIKQLLKEIPELDELFQNEGDYQRFFNIEEENGIYKIPNIIAEKYNMTERRLLDYLQTKSNKAQKFFVKDSNVCFSLPDTFNSLPELLPFRYNIFNHSYCITANKNDLMFYNELIVHYLLLYHLSMIARYEIEWWSDLINHKPGFEYPLIIKYLNIAMNKSPFLIKQFLFKNICHGQ